MARVFLVNFILNFSNLLSILSLVLKGDAAACEVFGPTTTTTKEITITTTERPTGPPELCIGNDFRLVLDPNYCFRFFYCMFGEALPGECDGNKIFDEQFRGCINGDWRTCEPRV